MHLFVSAAVGAGLVILAPWIERKYRERYGDDDGDGETNFLLDFFGGMVGLFVLFLIGAGVWYLMFER